MEFNDNLTNEGTLERSTFKSWCLNTEHAAVTRHWHGVDALKRSNPGLLHCPAWDRYRAPLQIASFAAGILSNVDVPSLLSHPKLLKPLFTFIAATNRFCTTPLK